MNPSPESKGKMEIVCLRVAAGLIAVGYYALYILLSTLNSPNFINTMEAWVGLSLVVIAGSWLAGANVKAKGHQKNSIRIFGIITFFAGIVLFVTPLIAAVLFASGRGT